MTAEWKLEGQVGVWGAGSPGERVEMSARRQWRHMEMKARGQIQENLRGGIGKIWLCVGPEEGRG